MNVVKRRERIARVRRVEHMQAAASAPAPAETLAARGELAHRLDLARFGLADAIASARSVVDGKAAERIAARIRQERAERLVDRAQHDEDALAEKRAGANARMKTPRFIGEA